jgi:hypothetical protein
MRGGHLAILRSDFGATKESEVAAGDIVPVSGAQFEETLASASPDVLRAMIREFAQRMMDADVEVACNAGYGEVTPDRVNSRNGCRRREWDTRAGTIELAIPKLRQGSCFPGFLEHRRRAGRALASVVATSYLLGVSTRRVEKLAARWLYADGAAMHAGCHVLVLVPLGRPTGLPPAVCCIKGVALPGAGIALSAGLRRRHRA